MSAFPPEFLRARLTALGCDPALVQESFIHSGGAGGQNVNKVATCVQLRYPPASVIIKMQEHRTQAANRLSAWNQLIAQVTHLRDQAERDRRAAREKKRRQNAPRPKKVKRQFAELKRHRARKRSNRGRVGADE